MSLNPQTQRSLFESVNTIVNKVDLVENVSEDIDPNEAVVFEFLQQCLGEELTESTEDQTSDKIYQSVVGLNLLTSIVNEYFGYTEGN